MDKQIFHSVNTVRGACRTDEQARLATAVENVPEAVEIYRSGQEKIDFVLLDLVMPEVVVVEAFDRLREINPDVNVFLCSGCSIDGQAIDILNRGCNAFIQKPFNLNNLSQHNRMVLDEPI